MLLITACSLRRILVLLLALCGDRFTHAGGFPNYHEHFDFATFDREQNVTDLDSTLKWWQTASFYQIYPRSFKDSNGDGVGDLKGIAQRLAYLREIGISATWLSPIFTSPMADFGYDIANYTEIDPIFGTMEDFDTMIAKATEVGVKIILDFVPNHTSDECEWFKRSAANDPEYKDFYIWHPGKVVNGTRMAPTNWVSVFYGPAWEWHEERQEYYLHQFLKKQPDLNYRNPKVRDAMKDVLRFWLRKGVYGFRIDAVPHVFEVAADPTTGQFPDEPHNDGANDPNDYGYLKHIYTVDQPDTLSMVYDWRAVLDGYAKENGGDERILLAETYSPLDIVMKYYGNGTAEGAQIPFNFMLITWLSNDSNANRYAETINTWLGKMPEGRTANWVIGNHDQKRVGSRLGADRIDMMNMLVLTLPGCSVTYNGEEIGMTDVWISWNDTVDPSACNTNPAVYEKFSRDPERTPFQWNDGVDAGFSNASKTWLPIGKDYVNVNVEMERWSALSHFNVYKQMQALRSQAATMRHGTTEVKALNNDILAVKKSLLNDFTYVLLMNIFDNAECIDLTKSFNGLSPELEYIVFTPRSKVKFGDHVHANKVCLGAKEAVVLRSPSKLSTTAGYYTYYPITHEDH